ncbi:MAG: xanthine dehydrogenase family protein molybdopterin-binding subunit [Pseudomonadota bacterium]|nr:xanthine dehydrogenase family protein molybdopterin-binding subunit [Pseudomonadota bacterium]
MKFGIGQSVRRVEDQRFTTGHGRYLDDIAPEGCLHGVMVRSPVARGRILSVDTSAALALPGVVAVYTGQDWRDAGLGMIPNRPSIANADGSAIVVPPRWPLCPELVHHVGDGVAFVVAETRAIAREAADLVAVDYDDLPPVVDPVAALAPGAVQLHDGAPGNRCFLWSKGDAARTDAALAASAHVTTLELVNNRVVINPMETRAALAEYDAATGSFTLTGSFQYVFMFRQLLAEKVFNIPQEKIRAVAHDVGGGFGGKNQVQPEHALVMFAARALGRPVKWVADRMEGFLTDGQGRDQTTTVRLGLDANHRFTALRVDTVANLGAYVSTNGAVVPTNATASVLGGAYDIPAVFNQVTGAFTSTVPTDAYRGAGRPEAGYIIERVIDIAAAELGLDPLELRRANFIPPAKLPYTAALGHTIDSGVFGTVLVRALVEADMTGFPARRAAAEAKGLRRGFGVAYYLEATLGVANEYASLTFDADGMVTVAVGTQSNGQSHETTFAQIVAEALQIDFDRIRYVQGDTDATRMGHGHGGSRSLQLAGSAILRASDKLKEKARALAAELMEAAVDDVEFDAGTFRIAGTDRAAGWSEVAAFAFSEARTDAGQGLADDDEYTRAGNAYPNGCHIAEVEVDPATGVVRVVRYTAVDDFGRIVNPMVVRGQLIGGAVQGIGQAILERTVYDPETGQLLSGSFMDYCMPRADDAPDFSSEFCEDAPTATSPMGVKGCGEAGTIAGPPAIASALCQALGLRHLDMPFTPERVWRAVRGA